MTNNNVDYNSNKENKLLTISNNLYSENKNHTNVKKKNPNLILESFNNSKKNINYSKNIYFQKNLSLQNYSFSNKASKNELSKIRFESLEKQTLDLDDELNPEIINKREIPIYVNHSDYFYCPNSKKEKNLNIQIMKYLLENNLIEKGKINIQQNNKKHKVKKQKQKQKQKNNNTFNLENGLKIKDDDNLSDLKDENRILTNNNESLDLNKLQNGKCDILNNNKLFDSEKSNYNIQEHLNHIKNNNLKNNRKKDTINQKNKINYKIENGNTIDKPKESFYTFRFGKIIDGKEVINGIKKKSNNNLFSNSSSSQKKINETKNTKCKIKEKNLIPKSLKKIEQNKINEKNIEENILKEKNISNKSLDIKENNSKKEPHIKYKISSNVVNEQYIDENSNFTSISLQSMNDSKMLELAEKIIPRDEELEIFKANDIINKRTKNKK